MIRENMLSEKQLNSAKHKTIKFKSSSCNKRPDGYLIEGSFQMRGKSNKISVHGARIEQKKDGSLVVKGAFAVKATDYGFRPYNAMGGAIANKNEMKIEFKVRGPKK